MAQLVRAPPCHGGGRRFESDLGREAENKQSLFSAGSFAERNFRDNAKNRLFGARAPSQSASNEFGRIFFENSSVVMRTG